MRNAISYCAMRGVDFRIAVGLQLHAALSFASASSIVAPRRLRRRRADSTDRAPDRRRRGSFTP